MSSNYYFREGRVAVVRVDPDAEVIAAALYAVIAGRPTERASVELARAAAMPDGRLHGTVVFALGDGSAI